MATNASVLGVGERMIEAFEDVIRIVGRDRLQALKSHKKEPGLLFLSGQLGLLAVTGTLLWHFLGMPWVYLTIFVHGVVIAHLLTPLHECCHLTAFRHRWLSNSVYRFFSLMLTLMPFARDPDDSRSMSVR